MNITIVNINAFIFLSILLQNKKVKNYQHSYSSDNSFNDKDKGIDNNNSDVITNGMRTTIITLQFNNESSYC